MEEGAREALTHNPRMRRFRSIWRTIPGAPRCKMCTAPMGGSGGTLLRLLGKGPWPANPKYCRWCFKSLYTHRAGAQIDCSLLFADVRGSTQLAESMQPREFRAAMDRFYAIAVAVLIEHGAFVDKFVGDEVIGIFIPALTMGDHAGEAIAAGRQLLGAAERPIGIGVNTGVAYVGAVGTAEHVEFTALGDAVNVAARLAAAAGPGELLATNAAATAAHLDAASLERRSLELRGKSQATEVIVLTV